jgi:hypothetical protein
MQSKALSSNPSFTKKKKKEEEELKAKWGGPRGYFRQRGFAFGWKKHKRNV